MAKSLQIEKFSCLADYLVLFEVCAVCPVCVCVCVGVLNVDFCPLIAKAHPTLLYKVQGTSHCVDNL